MEEVNQPTGQLAGWPERSRLPAFSLASKPVGQSASASHALRRRHAQQSQSVANDLLSRPCERDACVAQDGILDDKLVRVVVRVKIAGEFAQIVGDLMRFQRESGGAKQLRILGDATNQRDLMRLR